MHFTIAAAATEATGAVGFAANALVRHLLTFSRKKIALSIFAKDDDWTTFAAFKKGRRFAAKHQLSNSKRTSNIEKQQKLEPGSKKRL